MKYENIVEGVFIDRPNRFIAKVMTSDGEKTVHVKNTGRCREILIPGTKVFLQYFPNSLEARHILPKSAEDDGVRKMAYDLISVYKNDMLINMDSQATNKVVKEWLENGAGGQFGKITFIKPETTFETSRFDFYVETSRKKIFIEVKGVTLENNGIVSFPDAPTERGTKHINELMHAREKGFESYVMFVIQMNGIKAFLPAWEQDPVFSETLCKAKETGVKILTYDCLVTPNTLSVNKKIRNIIDRKVLTI